MPVESDAERASLLFEHGQQVTFTPGDAYPNRSNKTVVINAIFDNAYYAVFGDEAGANSRQPTLICRTSDTEDVARNSMVEVGSDVYKVVSPEPDGTGITVLQLEGPK